MCRRRWIAVGALLVVALALGGYGLPLPSSLAAPNNGRQSIEWYFSPKGGCTEAVVRQLNQAREQIHVQAYSFTSTPIAKALLEAHRRGVKIIVILDKSQRTEKYSAADFLRHAEIPTYIDAEHPIAHNKIMLIDGRTIITGSFNFTKQAETSNAENLLVIHDQPAMYAAYEANFEEHLKHSGAYAGHSDAQDGDGNAGTTPKRSKSRQRRR